jgi:hypothetical protein
MGWPIIHDALNHCTEKFGKTFAGLPSLSGPPTCRDFGRRQGGSTAHSGTAGITELGQSETIAGGRLPRPHLGAERLSQ